MIACIDLVPMEETPSIPIVRKRKNGKQHVPPLKKKRIAVSAKKKVEETPEEADKRIKLAKKKSNISSSKKVVLPKIMEIEAYTVEHAMTPSK